MIFLVKFSSEICSIPVCFGPASPDAGVELLRQLFLQCMERSVVSMEAEKISRKGKCIYGKESGVNGGRKKSPERRSVSMERRVVSMEGEKNPRKGKSFYGRSVVSMEAEKNLQEESVSMERSVVSRGGGEKKVSCKGGVSRERRTVA